MPTISEINVRIGANIERMVKGLKQSERHLKRSGRKLKKLGDDLTRTVSLPLAAIGGASIKMSKDLESSFSKIENLVGVTGTSLDNFKKGVASLSNEVGLSQVELSKALFTITSAGLKGKEALDLLEASAKASAIGMGETGTIAKAATAIVQAYGKENISTAEAVNLLTKTVREGNLEASELAPSIGKVIPLAAQMGISFKEVGANIATFTRLGISASESVSALKALLSNVIKPSKAATKTLAKYNMTIQDVRDSIAKNGLGATLQNLITTFDGNVESASALFGSVEGLSNFLGTAGSQAESYTKILANMNDGVNIVDQGFKNVSETAEQKFNKSLVRLQNISISIGNVLLPIFNDVVEVVNNVVSKFATLSEGTQKVIVKVGLLAAALPPLIKAYGVYKSTLGAIKGGEASLLIALKKKIGALLETAQKFKALNTVMKATVIGAIVTAVAAAVAIFKRYNKQLGLSQNILTQLNPLNNKAAQSIAEQKIKTEGLVSVIKAENTTLDEKKKALEELQRISPQYFGSLDMAKLKVDNLVKSQKDYISSLLKVAKVQAAKDELLELTRALDDNAKLTEVAKRRHKGFFSSLKRFGDTFGLTAEERAKHEEELSQRNIDTHKAGIQKRIDELAKFISEEKGFLENSTNNFVNAENEKVKAMQKTIAQLQQRLTQRTTASTPTGGNTPAVQTTDTETPIIREKIKALTELERITGIVTSGTDQLTAASMAMSENFVNAIEPVSGLQKMFDTLSQSSQTVIDGITAAATQFTELAISGKASLKDLARSVAASSLKIVKSLATQAIAAFVADNFKKLGIFGAIGAAFAGGVVNGVLNKAINSLSVPALAKGGLAFGPTMAMVGDNPNAGADPEVIAPLSKLKNMLGGIGGGAVNVTGEFMVRGDDLLLVLDNANRNRLRSRGF